MVFVGSVEFLSGVLVRIILLVFVFRLKELVLKFVMIC